MATKKISELSAAGVLTGTEQVPVVQSAATVRTTIAAIIAGAVARTNHTGVQAISTVTGLQTALDGKVNDTGAETIAGVKTFSSAPVVPDGSWSIAKTAGLQAALDANGVGIRVEDQVGWDPNAANNDAAFAAAITAAAATGQQIVLPALLKIGNTNHVITPPCGLVGLGGGFVGAASTILCTHANSRVSFGDQTTATFGGISSGFFVDGDDIATQPFYVGIVSSPVFLGVDVARGTSINVLIEGTQNGFMHINSYNGVTLMKIDKGAFTNYFPKVELSEASLYHLRFGTNAGGAPLSGIAYTGHNVFDTAIFERSATGHLAAVLHEAGFHNELRHCVLAGEDVPTFLKVTKPTASPSSRFHLNGVSIEGQDAVVSATGIDIAAGCTVDFEQYLSLSGLLNGIVYDDTAVVEESTSPTFATVTNEYVGTAAFRQTVFRKRLRNGFTFTADDATSYPLDVMIDGDTWQRLRVYGNGDVYRGDGTVAPVKVLGARGAAVADATDAASVITQLNALLARLRAHGLIAT